MKKMEKIVHYPGECLQTMAGIRELFTGNPAALSLPFIHQ
jgi:hypothetical protein